MRITKRQLRRIIAEVMPRGGVPDVVGATTGVPGGDIQNLVDEYKEWAVEYMGTPSGANSSSVLATFLVDRGLDQGPMADDITKDMAKAMRFDTTDVSRAVKISREEKAAGGALPDQEIYQRGFKESAMKITKSQLRKIIREEGAKSTEKYDDDSALKGDQDELPDALQKGIIDKTVEEREEEEKKNESLTVTRHQLEEAITAIDVATGEVWESEPLGIPDSAWPDLVNRLDLDVLGSDDPATGDHELSSEDFHKLDDETWGKQKQRSAETERKRLDGERITDGLVAWAKDAGTQFAADNPGVDTQAAAFDLAQSGRHSVAPDEWVQAVWYMFDEMGGFHIAGNTYDDAEEALVTMLADAAAIGGG